VFLITNALAEYGNESAINMAEELPAPGLMLSITVIVGTLAARAGIAATSNKARAAERARLAGIDISSSGTMCRAREVQPWRYAT
jgi:hypothetical protein